MKATGNYASIVKGVSQQAPADRLEGQHGEQLNMLSDPIRGLVRRNGMVIENQALQAVSGDMGYATTDSFSYRAYSFRADEREYDLMYRSRAKVGSSANHLDGIIVYDKTPDTSSGFIPVVTDATDTAMATYLDGGLSALTAIGSYVLMAGADITPTYTSVDQMVGRTWSTYGAAWVRGGGYARTYTIKATKASTGVTYTATYTTMAAMYPNLLDLSSLVYTDPDYQAQVNTLTWDYNSAVNEWISDASADIAPDNIAAGLIAALTSAGFTGWTRNGSHIGSIDVSYIEVTDGGDGSLFVSLASTTTASDEVTEMHYIGKVVKVQPKTSNDEAYYLKAYAKDGDPTNTGLRPVIWRESAGVIQTPTRIFAIGVLHEDTFYAASTPTLLAALVLDETSDVLDVPPLIASVAGDLTSAPVPHFYGKVITALALFQDRLMVATGSTVNLSRPGDYFNFYRTSVLTVADDDPIEVYALGSENDTIRQAVVYDHNLLLYGDKFHYSMPGRVIQTPATAVISSMYAMDNTAGAAPASTGSIVFCLKEDTSMAASRLLQTQQGVFQDRPQIVDASRQLRDYVNGTPAEMVSLTSPDILFVRTEHFLKSTGAFPRARPSGLYVYQYMDAEDGKRLVDSWSAWEWSISLGTPIGMTATASSDGIMVYTLAWGKNQAGVMTRAILAMSASARPDPTGLPYLDGMRKADLAAANGILTAAAVDVVRDVTYTAAGSAYSNATPSITDAQRFSGLEHPHYTMGDQPAEEVDPFRWTGVQGNYADYIAAYPAGNTGDLWTGVDMPAFVDITPPFVRNRLGKAKTWGRLTLSRIRATLIRTAGFQAEWIDQVGTAGGEHFEGVYERIRYGVNVWVGRDARNVQVRLSAIKWLPLTINALEWAGQWFDTSGKR